MTRSPQGLVSLKAKCTYLKEPRVRFARSIEHEDPELGIMVYGPQSLDDPGLHPGQIRVGFIGTGDTIEKAREWILSCLDGVEGDDSNRSFPGYRKTIGFRGELIFNDHWVETLTRQDLKDINQPRLLRERFDLATRTVGDKLRLLQKEQPPTYVVMALPQDLLSSLKTIDYVDTKMGAIHRDFRRAVKAIAMTQGLPTQILLERTSTASPTSRNVDHKSKCAWNFFTGLYYKAGGIPWTPTGLLPGTCFVGVSFFRPLGDKGWNMRTSVAQAFDEHGEGLVLRGPDFEWNEDEADRSPHLGAKDAAALIKEVLQQYFDERKQKPERVVIHKKTYFTDSEREGFEGGLRAENIRKYDLVSVRPTSEIRLLRQGLYPPLRGTRFSIGDLNFLYTTGYIPAIEGYPHGHVPSPLQISDRVGDTPLETLLREILILTKMNWNSASLGGLLPITLRFSGQVGEIMKEFEFIKEIPRDQKPHRLYKFYM